MSPSRGPSFSRYVTLALLSLDHDVGKRDDDANAQRNLGQKPHFFLF